MGQGEGLPWVLGGKGERKKNELLGVPVRRLNTRSADIKGARFLWEWTDISSYG